MNNLARGIEEILYVNGKEWNNANNDLLLISLVLENSIQRRKTKRQRDFYVQMLGEEIASYKLSNHDYYCIIKYLKRLIIEKGEYELTAIGVIAEARRRDFENFLIDALFHRLKKNDNEECLVAILRALNGSKKKKYLRLIKKIKNISNSIGLIDEVSAQLGS